MNDNLRYELGRYKDKVKRQNEEMKLITQKIVGMQEVIAAATAIMSAIMIDRIGKSESYEEYIPTNLVKDNVGKYRMKTTKTKDGYFIRLEKRKK